MNQPTNAPITPCSADEEYVFQRNAVRWRYVRFGILGLSAAFCGLAGLVVALCLQTPSLPDLALDPTNSRVYALHRPPTLRPARLARRSGDALARALLLRARRPRHSGGRRLITANFSRRHL